MFETIRKLFRTRPAARSASRTRFRPRVEALEGRCCPTTVTFDPVSGVVAILGTEADNEVTVLQDDLSDTLTVVYDGVPGMESYSSSQVVKILGNLGMGNDTFEYRLGGTSDFLHEKTVQVDLMEGQDSARVYLDEKVLYPGSQLKTPASILAPLSIYLGAGKDNAPDPGYSDFRVELGHAQAPVSVYATSQQLLDAFPQGGQDDFSCVVHLLSVSNTTAKVKIDGGLGNDTGAIMCGDVLGASKVDLSMLGREGKDWFLIAQMTKSMEVSAAASFTVGFLAGGGEDMFHFLWQFPVELNGKLTMNVNLGDGNDSADVRIYLVGDSTGSLKSFLSGGNHDDQLAFNLTGGPLTYRDALVDGSTGTDTCVAVGPVTVLSCP
jgi:hypothetical protein